MNRRICIIVCLIALTVACIFILIGKQKKDTRLIAWTETIDSGSNYIKIYSMENNSVVKTFPGSLIICFDKSTLLCYESKGENIVLYSISSKFLRETICTFHLKNYAQIIAYLDNRLYYTDGAYLKCVETSGEVRTIVKLKGTEQYKVFPQPSQDGKWTYSYMNDDGYYIDIIDAYGAVVDTIKGIWPTWYDTNTLLFEEDPATNHLMVYDYETKTMKIFRDHLGNVYNTDYSLFYTGGIFIDGDRKYLTYSSVQYQHFGPFELDYPQGSKIIIQDLQNGQKKEIQLSTQGIHTLWIIANMSSKE